MERKHLNHITADMDIQFFETSFGSCCSHPFFFFDYERKRTLLGVLWPFLSSRLVVPELSTSCLFPTNKKIPSLCLSFFGPRSHPPPCLPPPHSLPIASSLLLFSYRRFLSSLSLGLRCPSQSLSRPPSPDLSPTSTCCLLSVSHDPLDSIASPVSFTRSLQP